MPNGSCDGPASAPPKSAFGTELTIAPGLVGFGDEVCRPSMKTHFPTQSVVLRQLLKSANRHGLLPIVPDLSLPYRSSGKIVHRAWFSPDEYKTLYEATRDRAKRPPKSKSGEDTADFSPVVKLFCPWSGATWLLTELDPDDPDIAFGLCDLGMGSPNSAASVSRTFCPSPAPAACASSATGSYAGEQIDGLPRASGPEPDDIDVGINVRSRLSSPKQRQNCPAVKRRSRTFARI